MTICDIARIAGASTSTVSRVVNNKPGIRKETRGQILALPEQYDYSPNETARGLMDKASRMIDILIEGIRYAHYVDIAYYIEEEVGKYDCCSLILSTGLTNNRKVETVKVSARRRVDGVILVGSAFETETVKWALDAGLSAVPVIMTNGYLNLPSVKGVLVDKREGVENCVELIHVKEHGKLAFVRPSYARSSLSKKRGFVQGIERRGFKREELWIYECLTTLEDGYVMTERILEDHPGVEGVVFGEDLLAVNAIRALVDRNIKVPEQVAVARVDNSKYCDICCPKFASLGNRMMGMSLEAARILFDSLESRENPDRIMLSSRIVGGGST